MPISNEELAEAQDSYAKAVKAILPVLNRAFSRVKYLCFDCGTKSILFDGDRTCMGCGKDLREQN